MTLNGFYFILLIVLPASHFLLPAYSRSTRLLQTLCRLVGACPRWSGGQLVWTGVQPVRSHWTALCTWLPTRNWRLTLRLLPSFLSFSTYLRASIFSCASSRSLVGPLCLGWLAAETNTHTGNTNTRRCRHVWPDKQWWEQDADVCVWGGGMKKKLADRKTGGRMGIVMFLSLVLIQKTNLTSRSQ